MNNGNLPHEDGNRIKFYEDEIELMDYLLVMWKRKYLILSGTLIFVIVVAIITFIAYKKQSTMYLTTVILKPSLLEVDEIGNSEFIDTPESIKALIEHDLKDKIFDDIKSYKITKKIQIEIRKESNEINASLESSSADYGLTKLNSLIKDLSVAQTDRSNFIQKKIVKLIEDKTYELEILLFKEKKLKQRIKRFEKELSDIDAKIKFLKDLRDTPQNKELKLTKLSLENDYRNTFRICFNENENIKLGLFEIHKEAEKLSEEIEKLKNKKQNIQIIQIIQEPITTELSKKNKMARNIILSLVVGFFVMLFISYFLEYLNNYKKRMNK